MYCLDNLKCHKTSKLVIPLQPLSHLWSTPSELSRTTSSFCVGACLRTPLPLGISRWSFGAAGWCQGAAREGVSAGDWPPLDGAGRGWRRWPGPVPWLTGWRWTVCTCWGWEAAIKQDSATIVRKYIYTHHQLQVRTQNTLESVIQYVWRLFKVNMKWWFTAVMWHKTKGGIWLVGENEKAW